MTPSSIFATIFMVLCSLQAIVHARSNLPVFFFHEVMGSANASMYINANITAEGRVFNALDFCTGSCTLQPLNMQVALAIQQIRSIIAKTPSAYQNGYTFVGHAQGATIARAVIESMDEHNVTTFISLAGIHNGFFYGSQSSDIVPAIALVQALGPGMIPQSTFNFSGYTFGDLTGKLQSDMAKSIAINQTANSMYALANLLYQPDCITWKSTNPFLPQLNNLNTCSTTNCTANQAQHKKNFLKLQDAFFFGSARDGVVAPYQTSLLGQYANPAGAGDCSLAYIQNMTVLPMNQTYEYVHDTYGLQTLDKRNGVHLYNMTATPHQCWIHNATFVDNANATCNFNVLYDLAIYPALNYVR